MTVGVTDAESSANGLLVNIGRHLPDESQSERSNCHPSAGYGARAAHVVFFLLYRFNEVAFGRNRPMASAILSNKAEDFSLYEARAMHSSL